MKTATSIKQQIDILRNRGMAFDNEIKAKEILGDIGYYRLGFYWFPYEMGYPNKKNRTHVFKPGTTFENAVALYYFDNDLRNILTHYLQRIEITFRTRIIYEVSNHYFHNPTWFADSKIVGGKFAEQLGTFYTDIKKNNVIKLHHRKYPNDIYAPAWKTLEYMTLGSILYLFENLRNEELQKKIMSYFQYTDLNVFKSRMEVVRIMRNACAHGRNLFDLKFSKPFRAGRLKMLSATQRSSISGGIIVASEILKAISENRSKELLEKVISLIEQPQFSNITKQTSYVMPVITTKKG